ncbi:MAG: DUF1592 domain-containing protein [Acidobacteria bacterium]|nr:DUF1592 domain-containing protein [Acidobacteriota bacterium]
MEAVVPRLLRYALLLAASSLALAADYGDEIRPLVERYCLSCHNAQLVTGGVDLSPYASKQDVLAGRRTWERVLRVLRENEMPPADPQPSPQERQALVDWVDETIHHVDWDDVKRPGRVTIPRLSSTEYNNSIRDLTGLDLRPAEQFPADGEGESGFTNDRDGLFVPPLLIERYFAAAESVVDELIAARRGPKSFDQTLEVESMRITETNTPLKPWGYDLWKYQDTLYSYVRFPQSGRYLFEASAWGQSDREGELPGVTVQIDGKIIGQSPTLASQDAPGLYGFEVFVPRGNHRVSLHWYKEETAETNDLNRGLAAAFAAKVEAAKAAGEEPPAPNGKGVLLSLDSLRIRLAPGAEQDGSRVFVAEPGPGVSKEEAARRILARFAARAWRRPLERQEEDSLVALFRRADARGDAFEEAVGLGLRAALVSPNFLFRVEQTPAGEAERRLNDWELASRLSYFLWLTMPDERLFELAAAGKLQEPETLRAEVARMLADPKATTFTHTFAAEWLGYEGLGQAVKPDDVEFPTFTPALGRAMAAEADRTFDAVLREDRSLLELIDSDSAWLNEALARHYAVEGVVGRELRRVRLADDSPRGGVLGLGATLTATSLPLRTSPVVRGKWILETLLGEELPPPPPNVGELPSDEESAKTLTVRQMYEQHRRAPQCASCHQRIDPLGFGLESFDGIGRWRETEKNGQPIDASGVLPDGEAFSGPRELKRILLRDRDRFVRTLAERMLAFALGRRLEYYDEPTLADLTQRIAAADYRAGELMAGVVESYPFRYQEGPRGGGSSE